MVQAARRYSPLDALTLFCEDTTLTATGYVQENSADKVIQIGPGHIDADLIIDVSALDATSGDEKITFRVLGCNDEAFSGNKEILATLELGAGRVLGAVASSATRYIVGLDNQVGGVEYAYAKLNVAASGTTPSITFSAWITTDSD